MRLNVTSQAPLHSPTRATTWIELNKLIVNIVDEVELPTMKIPPSFDEGIFMVGSIGMTWNQIKAELIAMSHIWQRLSPPYPIMTKV
jgi:hypothetical protein